MKPNKPHESQRGYFSFFLHEQMEKHPEIYLLTGDLGFGQFNAIRDDFPNRFINVGASEQSLLDITVGLAMSGRIPVCYSITPFLIFRAMETIRLYIDRESIPVKLIGGGRDQDYSHDNYSHFAHDVKPHLDLFPNIVQYWPEKKEDIQEITKFMLFNDKPSFLSLRR